MPPVKPLFGTPLNRAHPLAQGLVLSLLLNEGSGNKAYDSSGNVNHGTLSGFADPATATSGWRAGPHGGALQFDGIDDYILVPDSPSLRCTSGVTIVMDAITLDSAYQDMLVFKKVTSFNQNAGYGFNISPPYNLIDVYSAGGTYGRWTPYVPPLNIFQNYAVVLKGTVATLYINGSSRGSKTISSITAGTDELRIGRRDNLFPTYSKTISSYVYIYNRALSPSEAAYLSAFPYCMFDPDVPNDDFTKYFYRNKKIHASLVAISFLQAIPEKQAEIQAMLQSLALVSGKAEVIRELSASLTNVSLIEGTASRLQELQAMLQAVSTLSGQAQISRQVSADLQAIGFPEAVASAIRTFYELTAHLVAVSQGSANAYEEQDISAQLIAIAALNGRALAHCRTVVLQFETIMKKYLHDQTIF